ncbi:MAG: hypothetical protein A3J58_03320 [Candidatus Sungbacteria bacterium RIFCSPHIGHO2_02_FULL_52_23]|uniref:Uncharacterized protein n=1 Tax=Candidatus Sungbacteria bacterium RIFCSPHIGHO2_02_FULL_52_23 TaxID=1802274 RepID=A0A1G2KXS9_9BACT|nr:MAG: hypothetical protein A3J58_03320 [Candidatus Sungbacteria bacterium RIFCSPHIGHO2_02_FULL_52_23]
MPDHFANSYRRPWAYERYGRPYPSPDYYWGKFFDAFLEHQEKTLYLLVGPVLVRVKFEGAKGSDYARLTCTVMDVNGVPVPAEQLAPATFEGLEDPTPKEEQEVLNAALEKCGVALGAIMMVSDKYVEGHLKGIRLRERIIHSQKGV